MRRPGRPPRQSDGQSCRAWNAKLARAHARQLGTPIAAELAEQVLLELPIGAVVVDARYDIQSINAAARRLLGIHSPALGEDLIHLAHRSLADPLRDAVDVAFNEQRWQRLHELSSLPDQPGQKRHFEISSFLIRGQQEPVQMPDVVAILIADVTERERETDEQQVSLTAAEERATRAQELLDESDALPARVADGQPESGHRHCAAAQRQSGTAGRQRGVASGDGRDRDPQRRTASHE